MTRGALVMLALGAWLLASCAGEESCPVPGVATACACSPGVNGARACLPSRTFSACDCSGRIPLPNAVPPPASQHGGGSGGTPATPSAGRGGSGGSGGAPPASHDGGTTPPPPTGGSGGTASDAGTPPMMTTDAGTDSGVVTPPPSNPYRGCMADTDCDPGALCIQTPGVPATATVCSPACVNKPDCPVPAGTYEATVGCVTGYCKLDCTPVLFAPLLTCPEGMTCIAAQLGDAFCHDDGI